MRNFITRIALLFAVLGGLYSCEKDQGPVVIRPIVPPDPEDTMIHYTLYVQPIFDVYCIRCHNQQHPFLNLSEGISYYELWATGWNAPYVDTLNPGNSLLIQHLEGNFLERMPPEPPYPRSTEIDTVRQWMWQGAKNN